ncbi:hypothetical protein CES87_05735 [Pseudomonas sp. ERMR1:02]|nr:hypothetical protein CES87_05735 [Pseudomonas sp. ERMR1:02]
MADLHKIRPWAVGLLRKSSGGGASFLLSGIVAENALLAGLQGDQAPSNQLGQWPVGDIQSIVSKILG